MPRRKILQRYLSSPLTESEITHSLPLPPTQQCFFLKIGFPQQNKGKENMKHEHKKLVCKFILINLELRIRFS